jgi:hypothetical protein
MPNTAYQAMASGLLASARACYSRNQAKFMPEIFLGSSTNCDLRCAEYGVKIQGISRRYGFTFPQEHLPTGERCQAPLHSDLQHWLDRRSGVIALQGRHRQTGAGHGGGILGGAIWWRQMLLAICSTDVRGRGVCHTRNGLLAIAHAAPGVSILANLSRGTLQGEQLLTRLRHHCRRLRSNGHIGTGRVGWS